MYLSDKNMLNASKKMKNTDFFMKIGIFYYLGGILNFDTAKLVKTIYFSKIGIISVKI